MKKAISFSLWGDKPIYCVGALYNMKLHKTIYKDWDMLVYYDNTVPKEYIDLLEKGGVKCIYINDMEINPYMWRFLSYKDYDISIFRDTDSRIDIREEMAVNEWLKSEKTIHVMRDHPYHKIPYGTDKIGILAGMWGIKNNNTIDLIKYLDRYQYINNKDYGIDQKFLSILYEKYKDKCFIHDEFNGFTKFPIEREDYKFIGEKYDEFNNRFEDYKILIKK